MEQKRTLSYVMSEEAAHTEQQKKRETGNNSHETLRSFHHSVSHLNEMISKINTIEKDVIKNTNTVDILNALLQKSGIGGKNEGIENKAYFTKHDGQILLVLNTIANGKKVQNSKEDIEKILSKVDDLLVKNPTKSPIPTKEKKTLSSMEKIQRAQKRLSQYGLQIQEVNSSYKENTNDLFVAIDSIVDGFGGTSGKKIYKGIIESTQKNIEADYKAICASFEGKQITPSELKELNVYKEQAEELLGKKLEDVKSYINHVGYAIKGTLEGALDAFTGTAVFAYMYAFHPEIRDAVHASVGGFYDYIKENCDQPEKLWKDFLEMIDKELKELQNLPSEQQAEAVGKMIGTVIATLLGAKGMGKLIKSGKLRLKFKPTELSHGTFREIGEKVNSEALFTARTRPKNITRIIKNIDEVKNWSDLKSFVDMIDRVRFREGITGKVIQETIDDVRQGTKKISDIPNYGGIRETAKKLIENGGVIPDPVGAKQKTIYAAKNAGKQGMESLKKVLPFKEAQVFLQKKIITGYDHIDINITKLRTLTNTKATTLGNGIAKAAHWQKIKEVTNKIIHDIQGVSFPGKTALLENMEILRNSINAIKEKGHEMMDTIDKTITFKENLTKKEFQALRFEEGLALREIQGTNGTTLYEYRDIKGKKVLEDYAYASHFKDGKAAVTTKAGENITINTKGEILAKHTEAFSTIQRFENGGYRVFEDGKYSIISPEIQNGKRTTHKSREFAFMTEIHDNVVIGVDNAGGKYILNGTSREIKVPYHYVDDFSEHGVAAVSSKEGKWLLIDKEGDLLRRDGSVIKGNGEIVTKEGIVINKLKGGKINERMAREAREIAFDEEGYGSNLEALKSHIDKDTRMRSPDMMIKMEARTSEILKKYNIEAENPIFSHTAHDGILLFEEQGKGARILNLEKGTISKDTFSYIHTPDMDKGFMRVRLADDVGEMGIIDLNGNYMIEPKYLDVQIHDATKKLFEVSEMRHIGDVLSDGTVITRNHSDIPTSSTVKRVGLVDGKGKTIIETGYTEITKNNDTVSQGIIRGEDYTIIKKSQGCDIENYSAHSTNIAAGDHDLVSFIAMSAPEISAGGRAGGRTLNVFRDETSTVLTDLRNGKLSQLLNGKIAPTEKLARQIEKIFGKATSLRNTESLEGEIRKLVHEETRKSVKEYLQRNNYPKLTKPERVAVANYERELQAKIFQLMYAQIENNRMVA